MFKKSYWLWCLWVLIVLVIVVRIQAESTAYVSPDSVYYLSAADHLLKGEGLIAADPSDPAHTGYFAVWPAGYPLCIAATAWLTGISVLAASKLVNFLFLGLTFGLLFKWFGSKSWLIGLYFCSFGMLEIYSYSWSEAPFLFFVLLLCYFVTKDLEQGVGTRLFFQLFFCLTALFLFRYAGLIYFIGAGLLMLYFTMKRQWIKAGYYFGALLFAGVFVSVYLFVNKEMTGYYTGIGDRVQLAWEPLSRFLMLLIHGLWNQFTLARQYFSGTVDLLYMLLLLLQCALVAVLFYHRKKIKKHFFEPLDVKILAAFALFYLLAIVMLRKIQPFDSFDYRIMSPFTLPLFTALLARLTKPDAQDYVEKVKPWIIGFMLLSLAVNLPKQFLLKWLSLM